MGIFDWLVGGKAAEPRVRAKREDVTLFDTVLQIPKREFTGIYTQSPNGRFLLAWGGGLYVVLQDSRIIVEGALDSPNDGKIADNGVFILNDWEGRDELKGTFCAFHPDGRMILRRGFSANLYNNGLAANGALAVCQTCNAPGSADSSVLAVFDLVGGRELSATPPESGWGQGYEFDADGKTVRLRYPDGRSYAYTTSGVFLDRERWIREQLTAGSWVVAERIMREHDNAPPPELKVILLDGITALLSRPQVDAYTCGKAHRVLGECFDAAGDTRKALYHFDQALEFDPKVGVKRRAEQLRKTLIG